MINRRHGKLEFNEFDEMYGMFAYLHSDRKNASFPQADSAKSGCETPQLVSKHC